MKIIIDGAREVLPGVWETVGSRACVVARLNPIASANWTGSGRTEALRQTFDVRSPKANEIVGVTATIVGTTGEVAQWAAAVIAPRSDVVPRTVVQEQAARAMAKCFGSLRVVDPRLLASCAIATTEELHALAIVGMLPMAMRSEEDTLEEVAAIIESIESRAGYTWVG